jgi:hypothetical protein
MQKFLVWKFSTSVEVKIKHLLFKLNKHLIGTQLIISGHMHNFFVIYNLTT